MTSEQKGAGAAKVILKLNYGLRRHRLWASHLVTLFKKNFMVCIKKNRKSRKFLSLFLSRNIISVGNVCNVILNFPVLDLLVFKTKIAGI